MIALSNKLAFIAQAIALIYTFSSWATVVCEDVPVECARLREECNETVTCCLGSCSTGFCWDGLNRHITRGVGDDPMQGEDESAAIARELETMLQVDVTKHPNLPLLPAVEDCGYSTVIISDKRKKRIVGGDAVELGKYPWMVQLYLHNITFGNTYFHCGGTIINKRHILTAAHCLTRIPTATTLKAVTIGTTDRRQSVECDTENVTCASAFRYTIDQTIVHENYSEGNVRHDLGLIRLNRDINFTDFARPICLPRTEEMFRQWKDARATVVGWGTQNKAQDGRPKVISWKEQEVQNNLVSRDNCNRFYSRITGKLQRSQICAGGYPGKGDCQGDSGGPLFKKLPIEGKEGENVETRVYQFGIVSTGAVVECGKQGKPSVYTSVMFYMPWILDNLKPKTKLAISCPGCQSISRINPKEEIATGLDVNMSEHPNADLLPKAPDCGPPPDFGPGVGTARNEAGRAVRVKRVVGGRPFGLGSLAWMAQIYVRDSVTLDLHLRCSGFIISSRYVMTAAHCVTDISAPFTLDSIVIGNYNRLQIKECEGDECYERKFIPIEDVVVHEHFAKYTHENDIALIRLPEAIKFGRFLQPICLPMNESILSGWTDRRFTTAGWGKVSQASSEYSTSNILHAVNITLQSRSSCDFVYSRQSGILDKSRLCGGGEAGKGECTGDSGSPMMRWINAPNADGTLTRRYFAFGISSFVECGEQGIPGIYTNILYHMPWVMTRIEP